MNEAQILAIRAAHADLTGAFEAFLHGSRLYHDWEAHQKTIGELVEAFPELHLGVRHDAFD